MAENASIKEINQRAKKGISQLLLRQGVLMVLTFLGGIVLARVLDPADFGVFGITTFLIELLALFSDCGLAPSLIQRNKDITDRDLHVGFTMQQALVTIIFIVLWVLAPWLSTFYPKASDVLVWLVRALGFNLYLSTWRAISALQLERKLNYKSLAMVEVVERLSYQIVAVVMAVAGFGVWSLVGAVLARGILGTVLVYSVAPWAIRFAFDKDIAREILHFGLPYQLQRIIGNSKEWVTPTIVASLIGPDAVGYLMWGFSNGRKPIQFFQNIIRVSFPHFSRIQDNPEEIERLLAKYQVLFLTISGLWFAVLASAGHDLTRWIYTDKWLPAVPVLILASFLLGLNAIAWSTKSALSGLGKVKFTMRVTLVATILTVVLGVSFVLLFGFIGVPVANISALMLTTPWLYNGLQPGALRRILRLALWIVIPVVASLLVGMGLRILPLPIPIRAIVTSGAVVLTYAGICWLLGPAWLKEKFQHRLAKMRHKLFPVRESASI